MERHIKDVLKHYIEEGRIGRGFKTNQIRDIWERCMGQAINLETKSISFNNGNLKIKVSSSVLKYELLQNKEQIIEMLNEELGADSVQTVQIS